MPRVHECVIRPDGTMIFIYDDVMQPLLEAASTQQTCRVSDVEMNEDGLWVADLSRVNGPKSPPFRLRQDALNWEVRWLNENYIR